jgi:hypothetical protein
MCWRDKKVMCCLKCLMDFILNFHFSFVNHYFPVVLIDLQPVQDFDASRAPIVFELSIPKAGLE